MSIYIAELWSWEAEYTGTNSVPRSHLLPVPSSQDACWKHHLRAGMCPGFVPSFVTKKEKKKF